MDKSIQIKVEFAGGTELLFDKQKTINMNLCPSTGVWTIERLIGHLKDNYIKERVELFCSGVKIRPGILILINDVDYEILGGDKYVIQDNDSILFISTLHGG